MRHILFVIIISYCFIGKLYAQHGTVKSFKKIIASSFGSRPIPPASIDFGQASTVIGDIDGNGVIDLATNYFDPDSFEKRLAIVLLNSDASIKSYSVIGRNRGITNIFFSDAFSLSVSYMGDLDGDGVGDLVVGDPQAGPSNSRSGCVTFIYLKSDGSLKSFKQISRENILGIPNLASFGMRTANLGDLNNDGYTDLAVSAPGEVVNGINGCIYILFLDSVQNVKSFRKIGANASGFNGDFSIVMSMADGIGAIGDFNKDGIQDIAFRSNFRNDTLGTVGGLFIVYLNSNGTVKSHSIISNHSNGLQDLVNDDGFGQTILKLDDLDGDGVDELAVGAPFDTTYNVGRGGSVRILFMNADGTVKSVQKIDNLTGNFNQPIADGDDFGRIGMLGDFNNDSIPDLLVGSAGKDEGGTNKGALYLLMLNGVPSVGLNDVRANRIQVNLYPNPAKYQVQVSCPYPVTQITITDVTGKVIHQQKNNEPIQVQTWQAGMYYLQVNTNQGTAIQKLVKQ